MSMLFGMKGLLLTLLFSMKGLLFAVLFCAASMGAYAQEARSNFSINGYLTDVDSKEPREHVSVQLFTVSDSAVVGGTVSNSRGNFSVDVPSVGTYKLRISFVGYQTVEREVTLRRAQNLDLGNIRMATDEFMLKDAVVSANVPQVVVKKDTLLFNPEAFRTPEGSAIEELIKGYLALTSTKTETSPSTASKWRRFSWMARSSCWAILRRP